MRVVMYVQNDVMHDSRVLREAGALAAAGHLVTIVGRADDAAIGALPTGAAPVTILRVADPGGDPRIRAPWRLVRSALRRALADAGRGPGGWPRAAADVLAALVVSPFAAVRGAWVLLVNRLLHRPVNLHVLDFLHRWRVDVLEWSRVAARAAPPADVHHAHDLEALPAALAAARRDAAQVVYDKHEIFTGRRWILAEPPTTRWLVERWEARACGRVDAMVTVNDEIARRLDERLHPVTITVVHNCPPRWDPTPGSPDRLRMALGLSAGTPIALYHGGFTRDRGLVELALAIREPGLEAVHAVFLGSGPLHDELASLALGSEANGRIHLLSAVPPEELLDWISTADVAVMALQPASLNHLLSTPNKLFEAIGAGVPVVSSDFPERRRIVDDPAGPLGVLVDPTSPAAIAAGIREILDAPAAERAALRARCLAAAHARWNWETEAARLVELYGMLERRRAQAWAPAVGQADGARLEDAVR